jgi:hypothetical protein
MVQAERRKTVNFLEFVFQDFWHFVGFLILISVALWGMVDIVKTARGTRVKVVQVNGEQNDEESQ